MNILLVLIPLGLLLLVAAIAAFAWAVRNEQFEDLESEGGRILFDGDWPENAPVAAKRPESSGPEEGER